MKTCIIYNRVSSQNQATKNGSLAMQEKVCTDYAVKNKLRITKIYKDITSAFKGKTTLYKLISKEFRKNFIIYDVSRFSRNIEHGMQMAHLALQNKNKIVFIVEDFIYSSTSQDKILQDFLKKSQQESQIISRRICGIKSYLKASNIYAGGRVPYGSKVQEIDGKKKLVDDEHEKKVIYFINYCLETKYIYSDELSKLIYDISKEHEKKHFVNVKCYDGDNEVKEINGPMSRPSIARLLNEYNVTKRGKKWNGMMVKSTIKDIDNFNSSFGNLTINKTLNTVHMTDDEIKLFNQFKQFQNFQKMQN